MKMKMKMKIYKENNIKVKSTIFNSDILVVEIQAKSSL